MERARKGIKFNPGFRWRGYKRSRTDFSSKEMALILSLFWSICRLWTVGNVKVLASVLSPAMGSDLVVLAAGLSPRLK